MTFRTWLPIQPNIEANELLPAEPLPLRGTLCGICGNVQLDFDGLADGFIESRQRAAKGVREARKKQAEGQKKVH